MASVPANSFNVAELTDRCLGDADFACELLELFKTQAPKMLSHVKAAISDERWADAASTAHAFKGTAGNVGAVGLHQALLDLEQSLRRGDVNRVKAQISDVTCIAQAAVEALPLVFQALRSKAA